MGLQAERIRQDLDRVAAGDAAVARALAAVGYPEPRIRPRGYKTMLRTIVGQQVSVAAAASMWAKLEAELGPDFEAGDLTARDFDTLRACGLSRQKQTYARALCEQVASGALNFSALPANDEAAIAELTRIKGVGRWSAEIYLLFAEGRGDIWPAGDMAVQEGVKRLLDLDARPKEQEARAIAQRWAPHRGAMAILTWHYYSESRAPV
ncbi:MAG: DNA-3-methyladenine glycosylase 2 family protein [Erythrobacter sp.]|jgi:DNA-3-methyladenine glycosylase II|nr:DNA-3-methyladenine glycosylase 2 family protein [Erythrobacter sp.]